MDMTKSALEKIAMIGVAFISVAIIAVVFSKKAATSSVIQSFASAFGNMLGIVVSPIGGSNSQAQAQSGPQSALTSANDTANAMVAMAAASAPNPANLGVFNIFRAATQTPMGAQPNALPQIANDAATNPYGFSETNNGTNGLSSSGVPINAAQVATGPTYTMPASSPYGDLSGTGFAAGQTSNGLSFSPPSQGYAMPGVSGFLS